MMLPTLLVTLVFRLVVSFKVFDEVYLLTGGGPGTATEVVSFTIFRRFFTEDRTGYGAAISVIVLFLLALVDRARARSDATARGRGDGMTDAMLEPPPHGCACTPSWRFAPRS